VNLNQQNGKMNNGRTWIVVGAVTLVGLLTFQSYNQPAADVQQAKASDLIQSGSNAGATVQGEGVLHTSSVRPAVGIDAAISNKQISAVSNAAVAVARPAGTPNLSLGSALMLESVRASRARVRKLESAQQKRITKKQRNAQLNNQVAFTRRSLDLARNQLQQIELRKAALKPGSEQSMSGDASLSTRVSGLKGRIKQLEQALSVRQAALRQSQQQLAMSAGYPVGIVVDSMPADVARRSHHRF